MRGSDKVLFACRFEFRWGARFWLSNGGGKKGTADSLDHVHGSMFLNVLGLVGGENWLIDHFHLKKEKKKKLYIYNLIYNQEQDALDISQIFAL